MKKSIALAFMITAVLSAASAPPPETQIAAAVLPAPAELRAGAAVLGYNEQGKLVTLRAGKNELICLASDPAKTTIHLAATTRTLNPSWREAGN